MIPDDLGARLANFIVDKVASTLPNRQRELTIEIERVVIHQMTHANNYINNINPSTGTMNVYIPGGVGAVAGAPPGTATGAGAPPATPAGGSAPPSPFAYINTPLDVISVNHILRLATGWVCFYGFLLFLESLHFEQKTKEIYPDEIEVNLWLRINKFNS